MKVFWFVYSAFMCAPAVLVAYIFYRISAHGIYFVGYSFNEPDLVLRNTEIVCAFTFALLAVVGWIIATRLLFKRRMRVNAED